MVSEHGETDVQGSDQSPIDVGKIYLEELDGLGDTLAQLEKRYYNEAGKYYGEAGTPDAPMPGEPSYPPDEHQHYTSRKLRLIELARYIQLRDEYAEKLYKFLVKWVIGIAILLVWSEVPPPFTAAYAAKWPYFAAVVNWFFSFELENSLLLALVGGSTASVIGMIIVVAKFLFPSDHNPSRDWASDQRPPKKSR